jgi:5-methylcytosine-specific restriction endonuclease McrA
MKKKTLPKLKKELDKWFSLYVRLTSSINCMTACYTCNTIKHYKQMHAGHFQSRRYLATRWHLNNVKPQCPRCNLFAQGEQYTFGKLLDVRVGEGTSEELHKLARTTIKFMRHEYEDMIDTYKTKVKHLLKAGCS